MVDNLPFEDAGASATADLNRSVVRKMYELAASGDLSGVADLCAPDYRLTQAPGHPVPGTWIGAEADAAAGRVFGALGISGITVHEVVADGEHRVVGLVESHGHDGDGKPWTVPVAECFWLEDGKVTAIQPYYYDLVEVRRIADSRAGNPSAAANG